MAGTKFQYDESGTTFYYFLLTFAAMIIIPCTYFFWPKEDSNDEKKQKKHKCHCEPCIIKDNFMSQNEPSKKVRKRITKFVLIVAWIFLVIFAYKVAQIRPDYVTFDPFEILGISPGATNAEIKKAYRRLSLIYHPDKETGDEKKFMRITKAHAALTDEQARKNWEEYGNPDGPGAMSFGIALPSWIVEKENSMFVLMVYVLMLMIVLPVCVRMWWSNSSKYGDYKVFIDTSQLYYYFIHKTPSMMMRKVLMVLAASYEFEKGHNSEIVERPTDNVEIPKLMKSIPNLALNNRERPLCFEYSLKARALLYAHLLRMELPSPTVQADKKYILSKMPYLIQEFVQCASQLTFLALTRRVSRMPRLETLENAMKLNSLIVQAMWTNKNCMLQLPHVTEDMLRHFTNRKRNVRNLTQLASLADTDRRQVLGRLQESQYYDVMNVLGGMPLLEIDVRSEVLDDEDQGTITAGALVTVTVTLTRRSMSTLLNKTGFDGNLTSPNGFTYEPQAEVEPLDDGDDGIAPGDSVSKTAASKGNSKPWEKSKGGKGKKQAKKSKPKKKPPPGVLRNRGHRKPEETQQQQQQQLPLKDVTNNKMVKKSGSDNEEDNDISDSEQHHSGSGSSGEESGPEDGGSRKEVKDSASEDETATNKSGNHNEDDDDDNDDWSSVSKSLPKKEIFKQMSKMSHSVHCPYFPEDKQEHWWIYISDRKKMMLKTVPFFMTNLVDREEVELKFTAPREPGSYQYMVNVRCDSYVDLDYFKLLKLDVKEAPKEIFTHPQWDISEEEDEAEVDDDSAASDSDLIETDQESEDDDAHNQDDYDDDDD